VRIMVLGNSNTDGTMIVCKLIRGFKLSPCSECCVFFWVIPRRLNFICRRFGTLSHLHGRVGMKDDLVILHTYPHMKMEQTECSETSAYKIQTPRNYPEENAQRVN